MASETEIIDTLKEVATQLSNTNENEAILSLLTKASQYEMSYNILKQTDIGKAVGKLRKHNDTEISSECAKLVDKWKQCVPKKDSTSNAKSKPINDEQTKKRKDKEEEAEESSSKKVKKEKSDSTPKMSKKSEGSSSANLDKKRIKVRELIIKSLGEKSGEDEFEPEHLAESIETAIFEKFDQDVNSSGYGNKSRSICFNLKQNMELKSTVMTGAVSAKGLVNMTPQQMASEELKEQIRKFEQYHLEASKLVRNSTTTDMFKCGKCGKRDTSYFQLQTRSADEPMTTFHSCNVCGHRWRS